jgi:polysaccharide pyruvyl transferase WcaK-like protein
VDHSNKGDILIREAVKQQIVQAFSPRAVEFDEIGWGELDAQRVERLNRDCDLFVIAGSGYLFPDEGNLPKRLLSDSELFALIRCPKAAVGIGYNTLADEECPLTDESSAALSALLGALDRISVRDRRTFELVRAHCSIAPVLTGDPVLFYESPDPPAAPPQPRLRLGVNIAMHGPVSANRVEREIDKLADLLKRISTAHAVEMHYVAHAPSERMVFWLLRARGVAMQWHDPLPAALPAFYNSLDVHLCQMMHSAIVSLSVNLPVTAFAYDMKTVGLFDLLGLSPYCVPIQNWDAAPVRAVVARMIEDRAVIRAAIARARAPLASLTQAFVSEVAGMVPAPDASQ